MNNALPTPIRRSLSALMVMVVFATQGCAAVPDDENVESRPNEAPSYYDPNRKTSPLAKYSPDDLIRGLLMGDGPVAELVPAIRDQRMISSHLDADALAVNRAFLGRVLYHLNRDHPVEVADFSYYVLSTDPYRVEQALSDIAPLLVEALMAQPEVQDIQNLQNPDRGLCLVFAAAALIVAYYGVFNAAAVALNAVIALNVGLWIAVAGYAYLYVPPPDSGDPASGWYCSDIEGPPRSCGRSASVVEEPTFHVGGGSQPSLTNEQVVANIASINSGA